ncbi:MAG: M20 family metallopeptidase [Candidatus Omnitrophica bacterium]|nr:M20 family metallopeptidase [Candidatus Omnitrophota bacterium]
MNVYNLIKKEINGRKSYAVNLTKRLIRIPTVNPPGEGYGKITALLEKELKKIGLTTKRVVTPRTVLKKYNIDDRLPRVNLIADWQRGRKRTLHINGHYDVVPVTGDWKVSPFKGLLRNGKLYGRGAEDMKGTITSMILAVSTLKRLDMLPEVNVQLSFTPDEEIGGMTGFGWLVKEDKIRADYGLSEGYTGKCISCGNKGIMWARIECRGKSAHASVPYKGVNSFDAMIEAANALKKLRVRIKKRKTAFKMKNDRDRFPSMVLGGELEGDNKVNMVPSRVSFSIDRRLIPEENLSSAKREIEDVLKSCSKKSGHKFKMRILAQDPAVAVNPNAMICRAAGSAVKKVFKSTPKLLLMPGGTDMRYLVKKGIPSVGYSARGGENWHSDNEFIYIKSILDTAKVYAMTVMNLK